MLNQTVIVGRLAEEPIDIPEGIELILAVPRSYKNSQGEYETDHIPCVVTKNLAKSIKDYCRKEDLLGVKGSLISKPTSLWDDKKSIQVMVEKVTFLSNKDVQQNEN